MTQDASPPQPDDLLGAAAVGDLLHVGRTRVLWLARLGEIPSIKLGGPKGAYVFRRSDVLAYAAKRRAELLAEADRLQVPA